MVDDEEFWCLGILFFKINIFKKLIFRFIFLTRIPNSPGILVGLLTQKIRERSGSVVGCLTRDRRAAGSSLTGVTALLSLSKTNLS